MKTCVVTAAVVVSLAVAGMGSSARAAGQPQLPDTIHGQESAQERIETKRAMDPEKYNKEQGAAVQKAAPSPKPAAQAKTEAIQPGAVGKAPAQASPSTTQAPLATPGAVEAQH